MINLYGLKFISQKDFIDLFKQTELNEKYPSALPFLCKTISWDKINNDNPLYIDCEQPYYDKDYLSTYFEYHVKKFSEQPRACTRLHFSNSKGEYYGYLVLRPNENGIHIGRSYLSPELLLDQGYELILGQFSCDIMGERKNWLAYPFMMQEGDFDVCAHIAVWTIIRYYGNEYRSFADTLLGDIVNRAQNNYGRTITSPGLDIKQIAELMSAHSHTPIIVQSKDLHQSGVTFRNELITYIESGIPFVGFLSKKDHAVSIVGHTKANTELLSDELFIKRATTIWQDYYQNRADGTIQKMPISLPLIDYAALIDGIYVMDDNRVPYRCVKDYSENVDRDPNDLLVPDYNICNIDIAIVPLHRDMQLGYMTVHSKFLSLYADCAQHMMGTEGLFPSYVDPKYNAETQTQPQHLHNLDYNLLSWAKEPKVFRMYIASSNSFKEYYHSIENNSIASEQFFALLYGINLPKFVWCIEIGTYDEIKEKNISGLVLIDATAGTYKQLPWLFIQGERVIYTISEHGEMIGWETEVKPYPSFRENLKGN